MFIESCNQRCHHHLFDWQRIFNYASDSLHLAMKSLGSDGRHCVLQI